MSTFWLGVAVAYAVPITLGLLYLWVNGIINSIEEGHLGITKNLSLVRAALWDKASKRIKPEHIKVIVYWPKNTQWHVLWAHWTKAKKPTAPEQAASQKG